MAAWSKLCQRMKFVRVMGVRCNIGGRLGYGLSLGKVLIIQECLWLMNEFKNSR